MWPGASCGYAYTKGGEVYYDYTAIKSTAINVGDTVYFLVECSISPHGLQHQWQLRQDMHKLHSFVQLVSITIIL